MFNPFRRPDEQRVIDARRVCCPLRERDADLEFCLQCNWVREVDPQARPPFVRCRPPRKLVLLP
jgi:hypothetical protein